MGLRLWRGIRWLIPGSGFISLQVRADVNTSKSSLGANIKDGLAQAVDIFPLEWGLLIGIVLIALVVVSRHRKAP